MFQSKEVRQEMTARNELGVMGLSIVPDSDEELAAYDAKILGFEDESPKARALADIATKMLEVAMYEGVIDDDIGMVVPVRASEAMDYGAMIQDIVTARGIKELREIAEVYKDMPGAVELAKACAQEMGYELRVSA
jgi:hypothetical protein